MVIVVHDGKANKPHLSASALTSKLPNFQKARPCEVFPDARRYGSFNQNWGSLKSAGLSGRATQWVGRGY
jgi:hypothetical protein